MVARFSVVAFTRELGIMSGCLGSRWGWFVLLLAGCGQMLPPPPPPKMRTAPAAAAPAPIKPDLPGKSAVPRGPNSAPDHFQVKFATTKGDFVVDVHRHWAPLGADQFYQLVKAGYFDGNKFFRVASNPQIVQFGLNGDPAVTAKYQGKGIPDEPRTQSNVRGTLAFAKSSAPNSRTTQLFINRGDNSQGLDSQGFAPFGRIIEGMEDAVDNITEEYGEEPQQQVIAQAGNTYLDDRFPNLDYIIKATIVGDAEKPDAAPKEESTEKTEDAKKEEPDAKPEEKKDEEPKDDAKKNEEKKDEG
jgi:peptidyl-prolyl cis-trans isomerase A (cyclophilin A)